MASIASVTFETDGMIVMPCAMKAVVRIARGYSDTLLLGTRNVKKFKRWS